MRNPKAILTAVLLLFCFVSGSPALSKVVLDDTFIDYTLVDLNRTTAYVNITEQYVSLPSPSLTGSIEMLHKGLGYVVASQEGVNLFEYDDATGGMTQNPLFSCTFATTATGVSMRQDNLSMWAVTEDSISYYKFNGAGMSDDPALKVSGLSDVISVAAIQNTDAALVLQKQGGNAKITRYEEAGELSPVQVFEPTIDDPIKVSMVGSTPDFRLFTSTAAYYFMYDDFTGDYVPDPSRKITGLGNIVSGAGDEVGTALLSQSSLDYYINDDTGGVSRIEVLSPGPLTAPVAVSLKPDTFEQVFVNEGGQVQWWTYDDAGDRMIRDTSLELSGLTLNNGYVSPKEYYSKVLSTVDYDAVKLTVEENKPSDTNVTYAISSDGGATFTPAEKDIWTKVSKGNSFVVRAVLETTGSNVTPKILRVVLELEDDFVLQGFINPQSTERGGQLTVTARAISLTSGQVLEMDSCSVKYPLEAKLNGNTALPDGDLPFTAPMAFDANIKCWKYNFLVPDKTIDGRWPDNDIYQIEITGISGATTKKLILNLEINGNILNRLIIKTTNW